MTPFFIRTATPRDLQAISDLLRETWHATYDGIYGAARVSELTASWHSVDALEPRLGRLNSEFLVADDGERLDGMAFAAAGEGRAVVLHQLYVRPGCQRAGIGRSLLREIEGCFPQADRLRLEVEEANEPAIRFYRSAGFACVGSTANCCDDTSGIPAAVYEKRLT
ncbi:GNAT family N-acetyltransferase [Aurantimonas marianensis]|uniref:GNAT family N-acetyltransferase n=1 Tax=Aurantimonas marianensis TaxID=2920428 RepID=A0A9X2H6U9_9HYPH|nr:GNAT family N-acetyltransferase [Aurantimonas marianensis]MCP3054498.1 GNAT family N-acetyltransferase [Aurantimonas marianensis]